MNSAMRADPLAQASALKTETLLECLLYWERIAPHEVYLTQPLANGDVLTFTWRQVGEQARRLASYLQSLRLPPGSAIALMGKNSAHWIMADLGIWMAGHVSVPLYATLGAEAEMVGITSAAQAALSDRRLARLCGSCALPAETAPL